MPFYDEHPIRLLMERANMRRIDLARAAGITYGALDKLLMGMTAKPHPEVVKVLARATGVSPKEIRSSVETWNESPLLGKLAPRARAMLALGPEDLRLFYASFQQWREEFAENPTQFASLLRIPRATLVEFEQGRRTMFPPTLEKAIRRELGVDEAYTAVLREMPPAPPVKRSATEVMQLGATLDSIPELKLGAPPADTLPSDDDPEEGDDVLDD